MARKLTAVSIANARPGAARREISDGGSGLYLVLQPSGKRSWAVRYRIAGKPRKLTLAGFPPTLSVEAFAWAVVGSVVLSVSGTVSGMVVPD